MIIDASAIVAILQQEADAEMYIDALGANADRRISAATYFETGSVLDRYRDVVMNPQLESFVDSFHVTIEPVTEIQARIARQAYREFGRGSGSPAQLNFGDCFSYALAKDKNEPLLFKGNDFVHTDVRSVMGERSS